MRLKEASAAVWEAYPQEYLAVAEAITELGGAEGIILLVSIAYWLGHRKKGATIAAYATAGVLTILLVKTVLGLPRPVPDEAMVVESVVPLDDDPHGFPSGHAFISVVVYGGFATVYEKLEQPLWVTAVITLVVLISLSRVVLRLHYLGDILFGALFGAFFLLGMVSLVKERPLYGFAVALVVAIPAAIVSGFEELALVGLGTAIGGVIGSPFLDTVPEMRTRFEGGVLVVCGLVFVSVVIVLQSALADLAPVEPVVVGSNVVLISGVILLPVAVHRIETKRLALRSENRNTERTG